MSTSMGAEREVRIGLVLYGGVSLAIYINGVVQEFLHLVKATAQEAGEGSGTRAVYRKLSRVLANPEGEGKGVGAPVRFIIDAIAGTSAGGINGVFLAKALALDGDLAGIKNLWVKEGDIAKLINDEGSLADAMGRYELQSPPQSLLNSQRMYVKLLQALQSMTPGKGKALAKEIDLHITATDLRGLVQPIQLSDGQVFERRHKTEFHFRYSEIEREGAKGGAVAAVPATGGVGDGASGKPLNQFTAEFDPFLAFAARCTSSFPFAFEPMQFGDIDQALREEGIAQRDEEACSASGRWPVFYPAYTREALQGTGVRTQLEFSERSFADGGYLDNKPFSFVIDEILKRQGDRPVDRKLFYLEPDPDLPQEQRQDPRRPNAVANAWMALSSLPRYETIRGDLERARQRNREIDRLRRLVESVHSVTGLAAPVMEAEEWEEANLRTLAKKFGAGYATYYCIKISSVTDDLTALLCRHFAVDEDSLLAMRLRSLLESWRDRKYGKVDAETEAENPPKETPNTFLLCFDVRYRLRRLHHLFRLLDQESRSENAAVRERARHIRAALVNPYDQLLRLQRGEHAEALAPLGDARSLKSMLGIGADLELGGLRRDPSTAEAESKRAEAILSDTSAADAINDAVKKLNEVYKLVFTDARGKINDALAYSAGEPEAVKQLCQRISNACNQFEQEDMMTFPILFNAQIGELDEIDIYRVSPLDAPLGGGLAGSKEKVKGAALGAFAGFLEKEWRENDILWGRLDGAERVITAMLPGEGQKELRRELIQEAHEAIVQEELAEHPKLNGSGATGMGLLTAWMGNRLEEQQRKPWAETLARSTTVIGQILDALTRRPNEPPKALAALSRLGRLAWGLVEVSTPRSFADLAFRYWSSVLCALGVLLILVGVVVPDVQKAGWLLVGLTVAARLGSGMLRDWVQAPPEEIGAGAGVRKHRPTRELMVAVLIAVVAPVTLFFAAVGVGQVSDGLPPWTKSFAFGLSIVAVAFTLFRGVQVGLASRGLKLHAVENWATRADVRRDCGEMGDARRKQLREHLVADARFVAAYALLFLVLGFTMQMSGAVVAGLVVLVLGVGAAVADYFENERIGLNIAVPLCEANRHNPAEEAELDYPVGPVSQCKWLLFYSLLPFAAYWLLRGTAPMAAWVAGGALIAAFVSGILGVWKKDVQFQTFALGVLFLPGLPALAIVLFLRAFFS